MTKYIDAEKLIKSVNNYREGARAELNPIDDDADYYTGKIDACEDIKEFITSLQQELSEVDLEKEINTEISKWTCYEEIGFGAKYDAKPFDGRDLEKIARHFAEWGAIHLNVKNEKEL